MDGEGYFTKLANDVLQAADQVAARLEDSISVIFQGDGRPKDASSPPPSNSQYDDNGDDMEEALRNNPLHDIADGVLGDIMKNQVTRE